MSNRGTRDASFKTKAALDVLKGERRVSKLVTAYEIHRTTPQPLKKALPEGVEGISERGGRAAAPLWAPGYIGDEIVGAVGLAQSTVSEHLRILKAAGVMVGGIDGPRVCYALVPEALTGLIAGLAAPHARNCCLPDAALIG